jgi:predicted ester cyclase
VAFDVDRLLRLWTDPLPDDDAAAAAAFGELYTDPVLVNGAPLSLAGMVARARALQATFTDPEREVLSVVESGDQVAVAFRMRGRQTGPLATSAGPLPPTGRILDLRVIDVLRFTGNRIGALWMVADELGALAAADAVRLVP